MKLPFEFPALPRWRYIVAGLFIVAAAVYFFTGRGNGSGASFVVAPGDFQEQVNVSGTVVASRNVDLGFAANGRIAGVYANVGQYVGAGTVLAETENGDLVAALEQAQANLASLQAGTRPEEIAVASAAVANANAALIDAIQNAYTTSDDAIHNKADALFTNPRTNPNLSFPVANATLESVVEHDRAAIEPVLADWALLVAKLSSENAVDSARQSQAYLAQVITLLADANAALNQGIPSQTTSAATLSSYSATLATARTAVNTAATTLTADSAALDSAQKNLVLKQAGPTTDAVAAQEALVRSARAALAKTRVVAPFSGTITRMDAKVGEIVAPTTSEISMQSNGVFQIETYVPEVAIAGVAIGNSATTTLDAYGSSVTFPSTVVAVDPAETVKDGVPTYKTTLSFLSADPRVRSGMTTNVVITTGTLHDAIVIPAGAVGADAGGPYVSLVKDGKAAKQRITTGRAPALGQVLVTAGLSAGDAVLFTPAP